MRFLISKEKNYFELSETFYYGNERDFESFVKKALPSLYEGKKKEELFISRFEMNFSSPFGGVAADLIAFDSNFSSWWVIEVEVLNHSFNTHVYPQMQSLTSVNYEIRSDEIYKYVSKRIKISEKSKFLDLIRYKTPSFLVVAPQFNSDWQAGLKNLNVKLISLTNFRNNLKQTITEYTGEKMNNEETYSDLVYEKKFGYFTVLNQNIIDLKEEKIKKGKFYEVPLFFEEKKINASVQFAESTTLWLDEVSNELRKKLIKEHYHLYKSGSSYILNQ